MAAKRSSSGGGSGDSKQGLIITMVLFILLSLILAVTTYLGFFNGDVKLKEDLKTAQADLKSYEQDNDWYKFQALTYRSYLGLELSAKEKESLDANRRKFESGMNTRDPEKATVTTLIKEKLDKEGTDYGWDKANMKPNNTATSRIASLRQMLDEQGKAMEDLKKALETEKANVAKERATITALKDAHANALKALTDEWNKKYEANLKQVEAQQKTINGLGDDIAKVNLEKDADKKKNAAEVVKKEKEIKELKGEISRLKEEAQNVAYKAGQAEAKFVRLENDKPRGEITIITGNGQTPFINMGSADKVRTGLRFTVHGIDNNGKPKLEAKATLEIIDVLREHQSQARLIKVVDPGADPVMTGDKLFNPAWDPNRKKHVAIAGVVDLSGAHKDGLAEFIRELKRQEIEVDAYLDLKEAVVKGEVTRNTDYLILADQPEDSGLHLSKDKMEQIAKQTRTMTDTAARNAVPLISLREFLSVTGYPTPKSDDANVDNLHPKLSSPGTTKDRFNK